MGFALENQDIPHNYVQQSVIFTTKLDALTLIKTFEFLQVGVIFEFIFNIIKTFFGGLIFLVSYVYILLIPLIYRLVLLVLKQDDVHSNMQ